MLRCTFIFLIFTLAHTLSNAQTEYAVSKDPKDTSVLIFKGCLSVMILQNEPSFKWYKSGMESYVPTADKISLLRHADSSVNFMVFGGTWCDDTQFILPRFLKWLRMASFPDSRITLFGVDRDKKTTGNISEAFQISRVPTIIVMKNGKEHGRIVEYGKTGSWDTELAEIIR